MAKDVIMPVLGMNQDTAVLLSWLKREGDRVEQGEPIMEVETDKATMELDAPASGTLAGVRAAAGDEVKVGSVIAVILAEGEAPPDGPGGRAASPRGDAAGAPPAAAPARAPAPTRAPTTAATAAATAAQANAVTPAAPPRADSASGIVPASPKARRLAGEHGVSLEALRGRGRGPEGAVLAADVMEAAARPAPAGAPASAQASVPLRFERTLAAGPLLAALARVRARLGDEADGVPFELGDLVARFLAAVWTRQPLTGGGAAALRYRRVGGGRAGVCTLSMAEAASLTGLVRARAAAADGADAPEPSDVALLDLSGARVDVAPDSLPAGARTVQVVVGRLEDRVLAEGGVPVVAQSLTLRFAFDPSRVGLAEAASFSDRVVALAEEPAALALMY